MSGCTLSPPATRRRLLLSRWGLAALTAGLLLAALDGTRALLYRRYWGQSLFWVQALHLTPEATLPDPELGFRRRPGIVWEGRSERDGQRIHYRTDERGFRNPPGIRQADWVFIGDSFTSSAQVNDERTFVRQVARATGAPAVNLGVDGYGPPQELVVLRRYGFRYAPRAVIWQLFEGNDLVDAEGYHKWRAAIAAGTPLVQAGSGSPLRDGLDRILRASRPAPGEPPGWRGSLRLPGGEEEPVASDYHYEPEQPARLREGMAEIRRALSEGKRLCRTEGIPLIVLFVPTKGRALQAAIRLANPAEAPRLLPGEQPSADFHAAVTALCRELGCDFLDATPALQRRAAQDPRRIYFAADDHLDEVGQTVVAEVLARRLRHVNSGPGTLTPATGDTPSPPRSERDRGP